ncbi:MAG: hypothetical protein AAF772_00660 [Acidobacteriota bacterium]
MNDAPSHPTPADAAADDPPRWLDDPDNQHRIVIGLAIACVLVTVADLFYAKHGHFGFEHWLGFHALYGFVASVIIVLGAKQLRRVLMRPEDYYDGVDEVYDRTVDVPARTERAGVSRVPRARDRASDDAAPDGDDAPNGGDAPNGDDAASGDGTEEAS